MLKAALIGIGRLGRVHYQDLLDFEKSRDDLKFVAICDIDPAKLEGRHSARSNVDNTANDSLDLSRFNLYTDYDEMLEKEDLDFVVLAIPTDLHSPFAIKAMEKGVNVFSEKPMAHTAEAAKAMLDCAERTGMKLQIGHVLRFWPEYVYLKEITENETYGKTISAHYWRGGYQDHVANPSYENWIINKNRGGGGLFDQHVHDADLVLWLYDMPKAVFTQGKEIFAESANDVMLTTYVYGDKVITARDDTACKGYPFNYGYEVSFEKAMVRYENNKVTVWPEHEEPFTPDTNKYRFYEHAYYTELEYFMDAIKNDTKIERATPEQGYATIRLVEAEAESAACAQPVVPKN
ncbi:MAG: Gfo/Idh/MocA family oxidoreductase [Clostridia bacterium]|nr:Gfo/Idh/MocA family oxidoreductase [Clostridia bacterium]